VGSGKRCSTIATIEYIDEINRVAALNPDLAKVKESVIWVYAQMKSARRLGGRPVRVSVLLWYSYVLDRVGTSRPTETLNSNAMCKQAIGKLMDLERIRVRAREDVYRIELIIKYQQKSREDHSRCKYCGSDGLSTSDSLDKSARETCCTKCGARQPPDTSAWHTSLTASYRTNCRLKSNFGLGAGRDEVREVAKKLRLSSETMAFFWSRKRKKKESDGVSDEQPPPVSRGDQSPCVLTA
jgi:hypothetical protein